MSHKLEGTWTSHVNVRDANGNFTPADDGSIELVMDAAGKVLDGSFHIVGSDKHVLTGETKTTSSGVLRLALRQDDLKRLYSTALVVDEQLIGAAAISILGGDVQNNAFPFSAKEATKDDKRKERAASLVAAPGQEEGTVIITRP